MIKKNLVAPTSTNVAPYLSCINFSIASSTSLSLWSKSGSASAFLVGGIGFLSVLTVVLVGGFGSALIVVLVGATRFFFI
jgi:hypothetical protein